MTRLALLAGLLFTGCGGTNKSISCFGDEGCAELTTECHRGVCGPGSECIQIPRDDAAHTCVFTDCEPSCEDNDACTKDICTSQGVCEYENICEGGDPLSGVVAGVVSGTSAFFYAEFDFSEGGAGYYQYDLDRLATPIGECKQVTPPSFGDPVYVDVGALTIDDETTTLELNHANEVYEGTLTNYTRGTVLDLNIAGNAGAGVAVSTFEDVTSSAPVDPKLTRDQQGTVFLQADGSLLHENTSAGALVANLDFENTTGTRSTWICGADPNGTRLQLPPALVNSIGPNGMFVRLEAVNYARKPLATTEPRDVLVMMRSFDAVEVQKPQ